MHLQQWSASVTYDNFDVDDPLTFLPLPRRVKVKLTVQKEVLNGAILQQAFVVEFTVNTQMCTDCHRQEAKDFWKANVQVRQKVVHKKTLLYLEQLILKHKAHAQCVAIKQV